MMRARDDGEINFFRETVHPDLQNSFYPALAKNSDSNILIVGAGLSGLSTAYRFQKLGIGNIVVIEAGSVGSGASGENGGQVCNDYALEYPAMVDELGFDTTYELRNIAQDAKLEVQALAKQFDQYCGPLTQGAAEFCFKGHDVGLFRNKALLLKRRFEDAVEFRGEERTREITPSADYVATILHHHSFQLHPLNYVLALAQNLKSGGVEIYEDTPAMHIEKKDGKFIVHVNDGHKISADHVVLACNRDIPGSKPSLRYDRDFIVDYVIVSEPLENKQIKELIRYPGNQHPYAWFDMREECSYGRILPDSRLMYGTHFGDRLARVRRPKVYLEFIQAELKHFFPDFKDYKIAAFWHGVIEQNKKQCHMPRIGRTGDGIWHVSGIGGEGWIATMVGADLVASAIAKDDTRYELFAGSMPGSSKSPVTSKNVPYVEPDDDPPAPGN